MNNDCHRNESDDFVVDVEYHRRLNHEHSLRVAPVLTMAREENSVSLLVEPLSLLALAEYYLLVTIDDKLGMSYPVRANFEDNADEINVHLEQQIQLSTRISRRTKMGGDWEVNNIKLQMMSLPFWD